MDKRETYTYHKLALRSINKLGIVLSFVLCLLFIPNYLLAQQFASVGIGSNSYIGDLSPTRTMGQLNVLLRYQKMLDESLALQATVNVGEIEGEYEPGDPIELLGSSRTPNTYFSARVNSLDVGLKWYILKSNFVQLNASLGLGLLTYTIEDKEERSLNKREETRLPDEDYVLRAAYLPASIGLVFFHDKSISLEIEQSWSFTNTDYLDNISYLGDKSGNDHIVRHSLTLRYRLKY